MNKNKKIIIFGIGEYAMSVCDYFTEFTAYDVVGFTVDAAYIKSDKFYAHKLIAFDKIEKSYSPKEYEMFIAVGSSRLNYLRADFYRKAKEKGYRLATFIHPLAYVAPHVTVGDNCIVMENSQIMTRSHIGNNVVIWPGASVSHDCTVKDNCYLVGGMGGFCEIGENCFLGMRAIIADHLTIAKDNFITMASVIRKNTQENSIYDGFPAKRNKYVSALDYFANIEGH